MTSFAAVVVIHDSEPELGVLLDSLAPLDVEVVVVDSGSADRGAEMARERGATVVALDGNPGFGAASNAGVEAATSDVVALLNPDVELIDRRLADLAEEARRRDVILAPRLLNADGSVQRSAHPPPGSAAALLPALVHPRVLPRAWRERFDPWRASGPRRVGWAIGACVVARTDVLRPLGPFDATAFLFYEDLDLCLRAAAAGVPTEYRPEVVLRHAGAHSTAPVFGGEPFDLLARRRREVVRARLGSRALALDDLAQGLTFTTRAAARAALLRDASRERAQLRALRRARMLAS